MKKFVLMIAILISSITMASAQNDTSFYVSPDCHGESFYVCLNKYNQANIYAIDGCSSFFWDVWGIGTSTDNPLVLNGSTNSFYSIDYYGCGNDIAFGVEFVEPAVPNETSTTLWKHQGYPITLESIGADSLEMYNYNWNTGETAPTIEVTAPGTYTCDISDQCATATRTFIVRDNVELYRATCDLRSNLNQVTWQTTPQQAEYISAVNIYRNTYQLVATVPYLDGSFTDDIGSESTQWQYHVVGVDNEGNECPIPSYWKRTIHLDHVQGTGGGEILQWTPYEEENPAKDVVVAYAIYDVVNGEPNHVMDVGNFTNVYAYNPNDFNGYGTVAAVFAGKDMEDLAFSNLTSEVLGVGETQQKNLSIYPNPTNGTFTVQGAKTLTIYNTMGQVVARSDNNEGKHSLSLAPGVYFIKSDEGTTQKVVVE